MLQKVLQAKSIFQEQNEQIPSHFFELRNLLINKPKDNKENEQQLPLILINRIKFMENCKKRKSNMTINTSCNETNTQATSEFDDRPMKRSLSSLPGAKSRASSIGAARTKYLCLAPLEPHNQTAVITFDHLRLRRPQLKPTQELDEIRLVSTKCEMTKKDYERPQISFRSRQNHVKKRPQQVDHLMKYVFQNPYIQESVNHIDRQLVQFIINSHRAVLQYRIKQLQIPHNQDKLNDMTKQVDDQIIQILLQESDTLRIEQTYIEQKKQMFNRILEYQSQIQTEYQ